jgi:hypothetical protein
MRMIFAGRPRGAWLRRAVRRCRTATRKSSEVNKSTVLANMAALMADVSNAEQLSSRERPRERGIFARLKSLFAEIMSFNTSSAGSAAGSTCSCSLIERSKSSASCNCLRCRPAHGWRRRTPPRGSDRIVLGPYSRLPSPPSNCCDSVLVRTPLRTITDARNSRARPSLHARSPPRAPRLGYI